MELLDKVLSVDTLDKKPSVIFLPGHFFFVQALELPQGMARSELDSFVEIALEERAPFPLPQLYYGAYHVEGSGRVLIYAAYNKRFTSGERELWEDADLVVPDFISVFGLASTQSALHVVLGDGAVTAVYFDGRDPVPARIASRGFEPEAGPRQKFGAIDEIITQFQSGGNRPPVRYFRRQGEVFRQGGALHVPVVSTNREGVPENLEATETPLIDRANVSALDLRDKAFLAEKRKTATRDAWLWRFTLGIAALIVLLALGEIGLYAAGAVLSGRDELMESRIERVARIQEQLELAERMEELGENRLMPFEMLALLNQHRPSSMSFRAAQTDGWHGLSADVVTTNTRDVNEYENALMGSGDFERVEIRNQQVRDGETTFMLEVTFNPTALSEASPVARSSSTTERRLPATMAGHERGREGAR